MITTTQILSAIAGFILRWIFFADNRKAKAKKENLEFSYKELIKDEFHLIIASILSTAVGLYGLPEALEMLGYSHYWNTLVAVGCGVSSLDVIRFIYNMLPQLLKQIWESLTERLKGLFGVKK